MTTAAARQIPDDPLALTEAEQADVRVWLQLVKTVLPMEREVNRLFQQEFGQSLPRYDVLSQLERALPGGLSVGALAERLIASAGNITRLVSRMADEGLVARQAADGDRRQQIVVVTDKGCDIYRAMTERHTAWTVDRLGVLSERDKADIRRLLAKLRGKPAQSG